MHGIKVLMAKNYIDNLSEETRKGNVPIEVARINSLSQKLMYFGFRYWPVKPTLSSTMKLWTG